MKYKNINLEPLSLGQDCESRETVITNSDTIVATVLDDSYGPLFAAASEMANALVETCETCEYSVCGGCSVGRVLHKIGITLTYWDQLDVCKEEDKK